MAALGSPFESDTRDLYLVEWHDRPLRASWMKKGVLNRQGMDGLVGCDKDMQIIGNVHEHPALLKARSKEQGN